MHPAQTETGENQDVAEGGRARTLPPKKIRSTSTDTEPLESPMAVAFLNPLQAPPRPPAYCRVLSLSLSLSSAAGLACLVFAGSPLNSSRTLRARVYIRGGGAAQKHTHHQAPTPHRRRGGQLTSHDDPPNGVSLFQLNTCGAQHAKKD
jgi:hypothetical protein